MDRCGDRCPFRDEVCYLLVDHDERYHEGPTATWGPSLVERWHALAGVPVELPSEADYASALRQAVPFGPTFDHYHGAPVGKIDRWPDPDPARRYWHLTEPQRLVENHIRFLRQKAERASG